MSEDLKVKLTEKKRVIKENFDKLENYKKGLVEQRSNVDRELTKVYTEQTRLQGEFKSIEEIFTETFGDSTNGIEIVELPKQKEKKEVNKSIPKKKG